MKNVVPPASLTQWEYPTACVKCETRLTAEAHDLKVDRFKKPGTYWFDGSADAAGLDELFFVDCPFECDVIFIPTEEIPYLLQQEVRRRAEADKEVLKEESRKKLRKTADELGMS